MPSKKKKYNARFPPARIKKIMQTDEEVGKVAAAVPVIISRALELFVKALLCKSSEVTCARNAKTLTTSHIKHGILTEPKFDFLKDLVAAIPDVQDECDGSSPTEPGAASGGGHPLHRSNSVRSRSDSGAAAAACSSSRSGGGGGGDTSSECDDDEEDEDEEEEEEGEEGGAGGGAQHVPATAQQTSVIVQAPHHHHQLHQPTAQQRREQFASAGAFQPVSNAATTSPNDS